MANLTLKEQLEALSLGTPAPTSTSEKPRAATKRQTNPRSKTNALQPVKQKPAWLEQAQYGVELLRAYFPLCFKEPKDMQPLKVGIKQDLVKYLSTRDDVVLGDKACMVSSLSYYVSSLAYHRSAVEGAIRIGLDGEPAGMVTAEEAQYSAECRKTKLQKKSKSPVKSDKTAE